MDSFVGYNCDVINVVDNRKNKNVEVEKKYIDKSKSYQYSLVFFILTIVVFLVSLTFQIIAACMKMELGVIGEILLIAIILGSAFLSLVFATKTRLSYRIGDYVQVQEINNLDDKAEKYNLKF